MKTTVTATAIREMVNEVLDNKEYGLPYTPEEDEAPVVVDATVDPSAAVTKPGDPTFNPSDNRELSVAIHDIVKTIPDESIGPFYKRVKQVVDDMLDGRDDLDAKRPTHKTNTKPGEDVMKNEDKKIEETIRRAVRKILIEMNQNDEELAPTGTGTTVPAGEASAETKPAKSTRKWGEKASSGLGTQLTPWKDVASGMTDYLRSTGDLKADMPGLSVSGAKQMGDKAFRKARFIDSMFRSEEEKQAYMMDLVNQYIDHLDTSGELTDDDFALMRDNPDIVVGLEGFQEFMMDDLADAGYHPDIEFDKYGRPIPRDQEPASVDAPEAPSRAEKPQKSAASPSPRAAKTSYKVYGKKGGRPAHTRLKGQAYGAPADTKFSPGEQAVASSEDGKLRVKKVDGDHSQIWDPIDG